MMKTPQTRVFDKQSITVSTLFIISLIVFSFFHYESVGGRLDPVTSTYLQAASVSHVVVPGLIHPLYLLFSKISSTVLSNTDLNAYMYATCISILFSAITVSIVFLFACSINNNITNKNILWNIIPAIFLATIPIFWIQATESTAFSLQTTLLAITCIMLVKHKLTDDLIYLFLAIIFAALAISNHMISIIMLLGIIAYIYVGYKYLFKKPQWMFTTVFAIIVLGFMPYYLDRDYANSLQHSKLTLDIITAYFIRDADASINIQQIIDQFFEATGIVTIVLLFLGLWSLVRIKLYDIFIFIFITLAGTFIYAVYIKPDNFLSYLSVIAFLAVISSSWSLSSKQPAIRILTQFIFVIGFFLNSNSIYSKIPVEPEINKMELLGYARQNMKDSEQVLMEPSKINKSLASYFEAVTKKPPQIAWIGETESSTGRVFTVTGLSPDDFPSSVYHSEPGVTKILPTCCGLNKQVTISPLLVSGYLYHSGDTLHFNLSSRGSRFLFEGFTKPESWGVWSDGPRASLTVPLATEGKDALPVDKPIRLFLTMGAFVNAENPNMHVILNANNIKVAEWHFSYDAPNIRDRGTLMGRIVYLPQGISASGVIKLVFEIDGTASPMSLGLGADSRKLGIQITDLRMDSEEYIYHLGETLKFNANSTDRLLLENGFTKPESWGVWSDGPHASLAFPFATKGDNSLSPDRPIKLLITMGAFVRSENPHMNVVMKANGIQVADWNFNYDAPKINDRGVLAERIIYLPKEISDSGNLNLEFEMEDTASPMTLGLGPDPRQLGIELTEIRLFPTYPPMSKELKKVGSDPIPEKIGFSNIAIKIEDILKAPQTSHEPPYAQLNMLIDAGDGTGRLFVNDMRGYIYVFNKDEKKLKVFMDLSSIIKKALLKNEFEYGLLAFAFHPDFSRKGSSGYGKLYTLHTEYSDVRSKGNSRYFKSPLTKDHHQDVITEWQADPENPDRVDPDSGRELMRIGQIAREHNTDDLKFNPNAKPGDSDYGKLYISIGDGGFGPFSNADPYDMGQNPSTILGTIIRIDPLRGKNNAPYQVPEDNPFVGKEGYLPEIWAYGFRNPLRMNWDTGGKKDLYASDVGSSKIEEINIVHKGGNYGWSVYEGPFLLDRRDNSILYYPPEKADKKYIKPIAVYDHTEGFAVVGGFVYRGKHIPQLYGKYIFGDIRLGRIFYIDVDKPEQENGFAKIHELRLMRNDKQVTLFDLIGLNTDRVDLRFGQDSEGEIYILTKQDGMIRKIASAKYLN